MKRIDYPERKIKMKTSYRPQGVCSRNITFNLENGIVSDIRFEGGCHGNLQGIAALCQDMPAEEVIKKLSGIRCGFKRTSCPDQLACALKEAMEEEK